ncbi:MAG: hypothetical protein OXG13_03350 [Gemmatimonadaceae bacterium]|nr:hypothetical protein [Gemmatimonadaceae bacterium]
MKIVDGHIPLPRAPGLGVTLDEETARRAAREDLWFFDGEGGG